MSLCRTHGHLVKYRNSALLIRIFRVSSSICIFPGKMRDNNTKCDGKREAGTRRSVYLALQVDTNKEKDVVAMTLE